MSQSNNGKPSNHRLASEFNSDQNESFISRTNNTNDQSSSRDSSSAVNFQYNQYPNPLVGVQSAANSPLVATRNKLPGGGKLSSDRSRLQSYPVSRSPNNSYYNGNGNLGGRSRSTATSPIDIIPPYSQDSQTSQNADNSEIYGNRPKKWYSFTSLLSKHNLNHLLSFSKSKWNVSSVFVSPTSPREPDLKCSNLSSSYHAQTSDSFAPISPKIGVGDENPQVVYRRKPPPLSNKPDGEYNCAKRSSTGTTTSGSVSERSSGIGIGVSFLPSSNTPRTSRFSYGECSSGTANSPVFSTGTPITEFNFQFSIGQSSSAHVVNHRNQEKSEHHLGRSLPTLLEAMEGSSHSPDCGNNGSLAITVDSVVDLIYQEFAILTGSKSIDDHYLIIFPDRGNFHMLGDDAYRRLMIYLTSIPPMQDAEAGFVIIIDRRNDKWNSVKATLLKISSYFPGLIHRVFVLRPVGFLQKALSEVSSKLFRTDNLRFRLTVCNSVSDLTNFIEPAQLLLELGGYVSYEKVKWVSQRMEVEAFYLALQTLSKDLKAFTEYFNDLEYPNDAQATEDLLRGKEGEVEKLMRELQEAGDHGESLLKRVKESEQSGNCDSGFATSSNGSQVGSRDDESSTTDTTNTASSSNHHGNHNGQWRIQSRSWSRSSVQLINVISVEKYIIQIEETSRLFQQFWEKEKAALDRCLRLRKFEQRFRELQVCFDLHSKQLAEFPDMGECLQATESLLENTLAFEATVTGDINEALELEQVGRDIIAATNMSAIDSVEPKCIELSRMASHFRFVIEEKLNKQREWREVQFTIEKANLLCNEGISLMAYGNGVDNMEDCLDMGNTFISKIDAYLDKVMLMMDELISLKNNLTGGANSQCKTLVKQVFRRVEDSQLMCAKRRSFVVQQILKTKSRCQSSSSLQSVPLQSSNSHILFPELKSAKSTSQIDFVVVGEEANTSSTTPSLKSGSSSLSLDGTTGASSFRGNNNNSGSLGSNGSSNHTTSSNNACEDSWEMKRIKRGHILNELLKTETTYVEEIGDILHDYRDQALNPEMHSLLPHQLQAEVSGSNKGKFKDFRKTSSNVAVLFCNLDEIYAFHSKIFLPDLSNCIRTTELVGLCFIQRHSDFLAMYSQYCQLLPASERLRKEIGENHPWFLACRNKLGHKLPLGAYLLKPVQRITKYHLLLKDLVKYSEGCEGYTEIVDALECMLVVLRCVNDGMHQLAITGYPGRLIDEGYLILQGPFMLWNETTKDRLRLKGHQRHLFLYQKSILICKKGAKSSSYDLRDKVNLSEVGLTESLKGSGSTKKFEVWVNGRQKVYVLQAETVEIKELWVREIKKLLLEQLENLRATKSQSLGGYTSQNVTAAVNKRHKMMGQKGMSLNGWRVTHSGHKALRQIASWDNQDKRQKSHDHELDEEVCWSSDVSASDDEESVTISAHLSNNKVASGTGVDNTNSNSSNSPPKFAVLADYSSMSVGELSLKEGDTVTMMKIGCAGWWFVKVVGSNSGTTIGVEGWAPSAYLERMDGTGSQRTSVSLPGTSYAEDSCSQNALGNDAIYPKKMNRDDKLSRRSSSPMMMRCGSNKKKSFSESSENISSLLR